MCWVFPSMRHTTAAGSRGVGQETGGSNLKCVNLDFRVFHMQHGTTPSSPRQGPRDGYHVSLLEFPSSFRETTLDYLLLSTPTLHNGPPRPQCNVDCMCFRLLDGLKRERRHHFVHSRRPSRWWRAPTDTRPNSYFSLHKRTAAGSTLLRLRHTRRPYVS